MPVQVATGVDICERLRIVRGGPANVGVMSDDYACIHDGTVLSELRFISTRCKRCYIYRAVISAQVPGVRDAPSRKTRAPGFGAPGPCVPHGKRGATPSLTTTDRLPQAESSPDTLVCVRVSIVHRYSPHSPRLHACDDWFQSSRHA